MCRYRPRTPRISESARRVEGGDRDHHAEVEGEDEGVTGVRFADFALDEQKALVAAAMEALADQGLPGRRR